MKILVVHRRKEIVDRIKLVLRESEPLIRFCDSGLDGLLSARIDVYNLIVSGTDLPVITGFELVRSLRNGTTNKHTPVIFLADHAMENATHLGRSLGVKHVLETRDMESRLPAAVAECAEATEAHRLASLRNPGMDN